MKTDVIVLGAGASVSAGFPTNEGLANYVIYDLPKRNIPPSEGKDEFHIDAFHREWRELSRILGESNCLSIDEFCQISHSDASLVARMKQALRLALIDHANDWWKPDVEYRRFITTLFKPNTIIPENRFTIVNFNYDGLLGKLLADAVRQRHLRARVTMPPLEQLAGYAGGFYNEPNDDLMKLRIPAVANDMDGVEAFGHFMPHGTITAVKEGPNLLSQLNLIYTQLEEVTVWDGQERKVIPRARWFTDLYYYESLIHFPWETTQRLEVYERQIEAAALAVQRARRIHFIGLSGHNLLRHSLRNIFRYVDSTAGFNDKRWHLATIDPNPGRVFNRLLDCILPETFLSDTSWKSSLHENLTVYQSFGEWLRESPHSDPA